MSNNDRSNDENPTTDDTDRNGQMPPQPSDAPKPKPGEAEQNPPIAPPNEAWSKQ